MGVCVSKGSNANVVSPDGNRSALPETLSGLAWNVQLCGGESVFFVVVIGKARLRVLSGAVIARCDGAGMVQLLEKPQHWHCACALRCSGPTQRSCCFGVARCISLCHSP
eukprot:3773640-Rhodomonas_salina.3